MGNNGGSNGSSQQHQHEVEMQAIVAAIARRSLCSACQTLDELEEEGRKITERELIALMCLVGFLEDWERLVGGDE